MYVCNGNVRVRVIISVSAEFQTITTGLLPPLMVWRARKTRRHRTR